MSQHQIDPARLTLGELEPSPMPGAHGFAFVLHADGALETHPGSDDPEALAGVVLGFSRFALENPSAVLRMCRGH